MPSLTHSTCTNDDDDRENDDAVDVLHVIERAVGDEKGELPSELYVSGGDLFTCHDDIGTGAEQKKSDTPPPSSSSSSSSSSYITSSDDMQNESSCLDHRDAERTAISSDGCRTSDKSSSSSSSCASLTTAIVMSDGEAVPHASTQSAEHDNECVSDRAHPPAQSMSAMSLICVETSSLCANTGVHHDDVTPNADDVDVLSSSVRSSHHSLCCVETSTTSTSHHHHHYISSRCSHDAASTSSSLSPEMRAEVMRQLTENNDSAVATMLTTTAVDDLLIIHRSVFA